MKIFPVGNISYQRIEIGNYEITLACVCKLGGLRVMDLPFLIVTLCSAFRACHSDVQGFCNQGGHFGIQTRFAFVTN